jgi:putative cardiolipin synthase
MKFIHRPLRLFTFPLLSKDNMKTLAILLLASMIFSAEGRVGFNSTDFRAGFSGTPQKIKIFNQGLAAFEERLQMIEAATKTIDIEYFIYNADNSGRIFTQALINKAKSGVKVRLLLDYLMIKKQITPFHSFELEKLGIEVKYFNPTALLNLVKGQYRNHRKVLIIDGKVAMTGGRNIGDEYFDLSPKFNFLDRDIEIIGPVVDSMQSTFESVWNSKASQKVAREKFPKEPSYTAETDSELDRYNEEVRKWTKAEKEAKDFLLPENLDLSQADSIRAKGKDELVHEYQGECSDMTFNSEYPLTDKSNREDRIIKLDLYSRIQNAKESILFDSPYFIDDKASSEALKIALQNKVKIKLLTNSLYSTDAVYVFDVFDSIINKWLQLGVDPYAFKGDIPENYEVLNSEIAKARFGVHAKTFVFDNKDVVIGTYNFDPRSSNYNTEMVVSCDNNPELAQVITSDIETRMKGSMHLDSEQAINQTRFSRVSLLKKIEYILLKIPSNMFSYLL